MDGPRVHADLELNGVTITIDETQYNDAIQLTDFFKHWEQSWEV